MFIAVRAHIAQPARARARRPRTRRAVGRARAVIRLVLLMYAHACMHHVMEMRRDARVGLFVAAHAQKNR